MPPLESHIQRINQLLDLGDKTLATRQQHSRGTYVDTASFQQFRTSSLSLIISVYGSSHPYYVDFNRTVKDTLPSSTKYGIGILNGIKSEAESGNLLNNKEHNESLYPLYNIFDRFHIISRQLKSRHGDRPTLIVDDEYDVQDLLHSLLKVHFDDIRPEEWTPSYAGKSSRMDFLLPEHQLVIEVKKTRKSLTGKDVGDELIIDIDRYRKYPNVKFLFCFIYDPEGYVANPKGFENDLSRIRDGLDVKVYVRPSF